MLDAEALAKIPGDWNLDKTALKTLECLPKEQQKYTIQNAVSKNLSSSIEASKLVTKVARNTMKRLPLRARVSISKRFNAILARASYTGDIFGEFAARARSDALSIISSLSTVNQQRADDVIRRFCYQWLQCGDVLKPGRERIVINGIQPEIDTIARYLSIPGKENKASIANSLNGFRWMDDDLNAVKAYLHCNTENFELCPICLAWLDDDVLHLPLPGLH